MEGFLFMAISDFANYFADVSERCNVKSWV